MLESQIHKYRISFSYGKKILLAFQHNLDEIFSFFSLRKSKRFWGVVYDSISKQPLDPVIVKLAYADGREAETCVTDMAGRYGFLAKPGKFKILARKTNYKFPSKYVSASSDGIFDNLYHGQFFVLSSESEVVGPNIPMDPEGFDWNQQAKENMERTHAYLKLFLKKLASVLFWFSLFFFMLAVWAYYPEAPNWLTVVVSVYFVLVVSAKIIPESRLWGIVKVKRGAVSQEGLFLELHNSQFPQISFGKAVSHEGGRFLLRANPGRYILTVSSVNPGKQKILLGTTMVKVGRSGVLNDDLKVSEVV